MHVRTYIHTYVKYKQVCIYNVYIAPDIIVTLLNHVHNNTHREIECNNWMPTLPKVGYCLNDGRLWKNGEASGANRRKEGQDNVRSSQHCERNADSAICHTNRYPDSSHECYRSTNRPFLFTYTWSSFSYTHQPFFLSYSSSFLFIIWPDTHYATTCGPSTSTGVGGSTMLLPPPSPNWQYLKPAHLVIECMRDTIVPGSVDHVAIKLVTECVLGEGVIATVGTNEQGLKYFQQILR